MTIGEKISFIACTGLTIIYAIALLIILNQNNIKTKKINELTHKLNQYESIDVPFKGEVDSLKSNISYKDSIIKQIKIEYIKDVEWVKNMPDSAAVALFHQLVWANNNSN